MSALREVVAAADPALSPHAASDPGAGELEAIVGAGDRAFVVEAIREGFLLHYGAERAFRGMDEDLRLLAGDSLYALGLDRLAQRGDLEAVSELCDLISASARAQAEGRPQAVEPLWRASAERLSGAAGERSGRSRA